MKIGGMSIYILILFAGYTQGQSDYTRRAANYEKFINMYTYNNLSTVHLLPKANLSEGAINVNVSLLLHALFDLDEVGGHLEMAVSLNLSWYDEMVQIYYGNNAYSSVYTTVDNVTYDSLIVLYDKMWTPKLVCGNSVDQFSGIGDPAYVCRYNLTNGRVTWQPKFLLKSTCSADVTYYPFDKQDCTFTILPWGFSANEVKLSSIQDAWDTSTYEGNGEWEVLKTGSRSYVTSQQSVYELTISLKRNPLYFAFNIIIPVLALSLLNGAVFWLPVESGERVGFSITCFLTFMVLLATILGYLPATSSTMSFLCYYVVSMMLFSGLLTLFVVLNLSVYHKKEQEAVPGCLKAFMRFWRFRWLCVKCTKLRRNSEMSSNASTSSSVVEILKDTKQPTPKIDMKVTGKTLSKSKTKMALLPENRAWRVNENEVEYQNMDEKDVTWKDFSRFLDTFLFLSFLCAEALFSLAFLIPLAYSA